MNPFTIIGWEPASARFKDRFTEDMVNVLIDHILVSRDIVVKPDTHKIWNPYQATEANKNKAWNPFENPADEATKELFKTASDHFPVTLTLE